MRAKILEVIKEHGPIGVVAIAKILDVKYPSVQVEIYNNKLSKELNFVTVNGSTKFTIKEDANGKDNSIPSTDKCFPSCDA